MEEGNSIRTPVVPSIASSGTWHDRISNIRSENKPEKIKVLPDRSEKPSCGCGQ